MKISVITGWQIPESSEYVTILDDQLKKKLVDDYQDLNIDEFEYALRTYGTKIKDWGKGLNLALIDDAICEYIGIRQHLSSLEEQKRSKQPELPALSSGPVDWSAEWEKIKESARNGALNQSYIITPIYDWLKRTNQLTVSGEARKQILEDCRQALAFEMSVALRASSERNPVAREKLELLTQDGDDWRQNEDLWSAVINASKQQTVKIEAQNAIINE
ncbi:hypothetical protein MMC2321_01897 [Chitinophaga sp. MM2321]